MLQEEFATVSFAERRAPLSHFEVPDLERPSRGAAEKGGEAAGLEHGDTEARRHGG